MSKTMTQDAIDHDARTDCAVVNALARELFAATHAASGVSDLSGNFDGLSRSDQRAWCRTAVQQIITEGLK